MRSTTTVRQAHSIPRIPPNRRNDVQVGHEMATRGASGPRGRHATRPEPELRRSSRRWQAGGACTPSNACSGSAGQPPRTRQEVCSCGHRCSERSGTGRRRRHLFLEQRGSRSPSPRHRSRCGERLGHRRTGTVRSEQCLRPRAVGMATPTTSRACRRTLESPRPSETPAHVQATLRREAPSDLPQESSRWDRDLRTRSCRFRLYHAVTCRPTEGRRDGCRATYHPTQ